MPKLPFLFSIFVLTLHSVSYADQRKCSYEIQSVNYSNGNLLLNVKTEGIELERVAYFISNLAAETNDGITSIKSSNSVDCWPRTSARFSGDIRISSSELAILLNADRAVKEKSGSVIPSAEIQFYNIDGTIVKTATKIVTPNLYIPNKISSISDPIVSKNDEIVKEASGEFYSFIPASKKSLFKKPEINLTVLATSCNASSPPQCEYIIIQILQDKVLDGYFQQSDLNDINNYQLTDQKGFLKQTGKLPATAIGWSLKSIRRDM